MKKLISLLLIASFTIVNAQQVNWNKIEKAQKIAKKEHKKIMIDVYTTWCGPCKMLDKYTFQDKEVSSYLNENFIPVKFNAESKKTIKFAGQKYNYLYSKRRNRGINAFTYKLLQGKISYPSMVFINEEGKIIKIISGFKRPAAYLKELKQIKACKTDQC